MDHVTFECEIILVVIVLPVQVLHSSTDVYGKAQQSTPIQDDGVILEEVSQRLKENEAHELF